MFFDLLNSKIEYILPSFYFSDIFILCDFNAHQNHWLSYSKGKAFELAYQFISQINLEELGYPY